MARPLELILAGDMTAAAATKYTTGAVDFSDVASLGISIQIVETGAPGAGDCKLFAEPCDQAGNVIGPELDIMTGIQTDVDASTVTLGFYRGRVPVAGDMVDSAGGATHDITPTKDILFAFPTVKFTLEVTTQNDGTTSDATVTLHIQRG